LAQVGQAVACSLIERIAHLIVRHLTILGILAFLARQIYLTSRKSLLEDQQLGFHVVRA
jgi:hypothetical protein